MKCFHNQIIFINEETRFMNQNKIVLYIEIHFITIIINNLFD